MRQPGKVIQFEVAGGVVQAEEFVLRWSDGLDEVRAAYRDQVRVSVELGLLGTEDRSRTVEQLDRMVAEDRGEMWPLDDRAWLLTPGRLLHEPEGPWATGDREPRTPVRPDSSGAVRLWPPDL